VGAGPDSARPTATDDAHHFYDAAATRARNEDVFPGDRGFVMVRARKDPAAIRAALMKGDFYASTGIFLKRIDQTPGALEIEVADRSPGEHRFTLIDAVAKKCAFMTQARLELALSNVDILHRRVEQLHGAHFDVIVARALGSLASFTSLTQHLLAPAGLWIAMKGVLPEHELQALPPDVAVVRTVTLRVPLLDEARNLVVLQARSPEEER